MAEIAEHHLEVAKTARYYTLGEAGADVQQVWIVCHGYEMLAGDFIADFKVIADRSRLIAAPEALNRFYPDNSMEGPHGPDARVAATWMTRLDRAAEIRDYVAYLDRLYVHLLHGIERERVRVVALGFSQGAATVSRWAGMGTATLDRVVLWGGALAPDLEPAAIDRLRQQPLTIVLGARDKYAREDVVEREKARMKAEELRFELVHFEGGHRMDDDTLRSLAARF